MAREIEPSSTPTGEITVHQERRQILSRTEKLIFRARDLIKKATGQNTARRSANYMPDAPVRRRLFRKK
jgi:hypothetical protein